MKTSTCFIVGMALLTWTYGITQAAAEYITQDVVNCLPNQIPCSQPPDRSSSGLDVLDGLRAYLPGGIGLNYLADDFLCSNSGAITNIQIWGSYWNDNHLKKNPPLFNLAIFENLPADQDVPYSRPGNVLWNWYGLAVEQPDGRAKEHFYDPKLNKIIGTDHQIWQYDFNIPEDKSFLQEKGKTYWLGVSRSADLLGDGKVDYKDLLSLVCDYPWGFGWKTSSEHFEDSAVFTKLPLTIPSAGNVVPPSAAAWSKLQYPAFHPLAGQDIDLAFAICGTKPVPEPSAIVMLACLCVTVALRYGNTFNTLTILRLREKNSSK
ncbi:MAG TPA: hypothetical protein VIH42_08905 [Thermoguttaceae bacterium]